MSVELYADGLSSDLWQCRSLVRPLTIDSFAMPELV